MAGTGIEGRPVNVGLVGQGQFGKLNAGVLSRLPQARIVAICDPVAEGVAAVGDAHRVERRFTDHDDLLRLDDLDCLVLVTPEQLHAEMAAKAISRGLPLFLEKPLATTSEEGRQIARLAAAAGVYLRVSFVLRFETQHAFPKREIDVGRFGQIVTVRVMRSCSKAWMDVCGDRTHSVYKW